jgi:hypothetical protein
MTVSCHNSDLARNFLLNLVKSFSVAVPSHLRQNDAAIPAVMSTHILRKILSKILLLIFGILLALLLGEFLLRIFSVDCCFQKKSEMYWLRDGRAYFMIDPDLGFRPVLGSRDYDMNGTVRNQYPITKRPEFTRILFIGDSITARAKIVEAIRTLYTEARFEYWNAGVESFNTVQEVEFYKRYNHAIRPDIVVLTFHNNDFGATPVGFYNPKGELVVFSSSRSLYPWPWLLAKSYMYRIAISILARENDEADVTHTKQSLKELKNNLDEHHIRLIVLLHPILNHYKDWTKKEKLSRELSLALFGDLKIEYFDLLPVLEQALSEKILVTENPGDTWHPSDALAMRYATFLKSHRFLETEVGSE